jgi:hypothetical protein
MSVYTYHTWLKSGDVFSPSRSSSSQVRPKAQPPLKVKEATRHITKAEEERMTPMSVHQSFKACPPVCQHIVETKSNNTDNTFQGIMLRCKVSIFVMFAKPLQVTTETNRTDAPAEGATQQERDREPSVNRKAEAYGTAALMRYVS